MINMRIINGIVRCVQKILLQRLGDIATISRGGSFQKKDYTENGIPCIHYEQIYMNYGLFAEKTLSYISEKTAQKQRFAESGDIIMAVTSENIDDVWVESLHGVRMLLMENGCRRTILIRMVLLALSNIPLKMECWLRKTTNIPRLT